MMTLGIVTSVARSGQPGIRMPIHKTGCLENHLIVFCPGLSELWPTPRLDFCKWHIVHHACDAITHLFL